MVTAQDPPSLTSPSQPAATMVPAALAGVASLGAGAIHCTAVGLHAEHRQSAVAFALLAAFQLGWGALALLRRGRLLAVVGAVGNGVAVVGWAVAKTKGIGFIDGLETAEGIQWADGLAALLATLAVIGALLSIAPASKRWMSSDTAGPVTSGVFTGLAVGLVAVSVVGMVAAGGHDHAAGHGHGATEVVAGDGHDHGHSAGSGDTAAAASGDTSSGGHSHAGGVVPPKAYDPTKPIDLGGVSGVSPEQQARAENAIALTLARLPQWSDYRAAESKGFHSIGDSLTGYEHFVNWSFINDEHTLDPDHPESLVYSTAGGKRKLVSAMYMLPTGTTLNEVPDVGGKLTQWHIHDNLCFTPTDPPVVAGVTGSGAKCRAPLRNLEPVPMIHIWIVSHPCGPFAALEGVGAGQIKAGETRLCDTAHGAGTGT